MSTYDEMDRAEIEAALAEAQQEHENLIAASKAVIREISQALNMKLAVEEAERISAGLSPEQRDQLAQLIRSNGIATAEEVGVPGNN